MSTLNPSTPEEEDKMAQSKKDSSSANRQETLKNKPTAEAPDKEAIQDRELVMPKMDDGRYIFYGLLVIFLMFVVIGGWMATAKLDSGVPVPGQVTVEGKNKVIQSEEGGVVEKIYVKTGDQVVKGQPLILLNTTKLQSSLDYLQQNYWETLAKKARLEAENQHATAVNFPDELRQLPEGKRQKIIQPQISIFNNDLQTLHHNRQVTNEQIKALNNNIQSLQETIATKQNLLASYEAEAQDQQELFDAHLTDITRLRELRRKIESLKDEIAQAQAQIRSAESEIEKNRTKLKLDEEQFYKKVKEDLVQTISKLSEIEANLKKVHYQLSHTQLVAPIDGTVLNIKVNTVGGVVKPAEPIMEIVPKGSKLVVRAELDPKYIDYVQPGLAADLMFPAFRLKDAFMPVIPGKVIYVAADSTVDQKTGRSFYLVKLEVTPEGQKLLAQNHFKLTAGMQASAIIKIGQQTVLEYLLKPIIVMVKKAFLET